MSLEPVSVEVRGRRSGVHSLFPLLSKHFYHRAFSLAQFDFFLEMGSYWVALALLECTVQIRGSNLSAGIVGLSTVPPLFLDVRTGFPAI